MSLATQTAARIDYLKFVLALDYDVAQSVIADIKGAALPDGMELRDRENCKISVLGNTKDTGTKSRYVIESWGEQAIALAYAMPMWTWEYLSRIDFRYPLTHSNHEQVRAYVNRAVMGKKGMRNITTFNTKPRQKTNSRDVGGFGITIGSRKSDAHTVVYSRGDELPVVEIRLQGRRAADIGTSLLIAHTAGELSRPELDLMRLGGNSVSQEMYKATGATEPRLLEVDMEAAARHMRNVQQSMDWVETAEEAAAWHALTTEEQAAEQNERFIPSDILQGPRIKG